MSGRMFLGRSLGFTHLQHELHIPESHLLHAPFLCLQRYKLIKIPDGADREDSDDSDGDGENALPAFECI